MHRPAGAKGEGGTVTPAAYAVFPIHRDLPVAWGLPPRPHRRHPPASSAHTCATAVSQGSLPF